MAGVPAVCSFQSNAEAKVFTYIIWLLWYSPPMWRVRSWVATLYEWLKGRRDHRFELTCLYRGYVYQALVISVRINRFLPAYPNLVPIYPDEALEGLLETPPADGDEWGECPIGAVAWVLVAYFMSALWSVDDTIADMSPFERGGCRASECRDLTSSLTATGLELIIAQLVWTYNIDADETREMVQKDAEALEQARMDDLRQCVKAAVTGGGE